MNFLLCIVLLLTAVAAASAIAGTWVLFGVGWALIAAAAVCGGLAALFSRGLS